MILRTTIISNVKVPRLAGIDKWTLKIYYQVFQCIWEGFFFCFLLPLWAFISWKKRPHVITDWFYSRPRWYKAQWWWSLSTQACVCISAPCFPLFFTGWPLIRCHAELFYMTSHNLISSHRGLPGTFGQPRWWEIFHLSLLRPRSDNNSGESDPPAEKSINKEHNTYYFWVKVLFADLFLQPRSTLAFHIPQLRYIALMWRYGLQSQSIPCDCPLWWAQNPSSDNGIHLRLYIACICYLWPSSNKSNPVSLMWTTDHCKLVKESG